MASTVAVAVTVTAAVKVTVTVVAAAAYNYAVPHLMYNNEVQKPVQSETSAKVNQRTIGIHTVTLATFTNNKTTVIELCVVVQRSHTGNTSQAEHIQLY